MPGLSFIQDRPILRVTSVGNGSVFNNNNNNNNNKYVCIYIGSTSTQTSHQEDPGSKTEVILIDNLRLSLAIHPIASSLPELTQSSIAHLGTLIVAQLLKISLTFQVN
jgi:hypothetical protein